MPLMKVKMTPNVLEVFSGFQDIVNFKIIDGYSVLKWLIEKLHIQNSIDISEFQKDVSSNSDKSLRIL